MALIAICVVWDNTCRIANLPTSVAFQ